MDDDKNQKILQNQQNSLIDNQRFYTTEEVAKILRVDPESVRRYVRSGKLRAIKLGGKFIRIDEADLERFIETMKTR